MCKACACVCVYQLGGRARVAVFRTRVYFVFYGRSAHALYYVHTYVCRRVKIR